MSDLKALTSSEGGFGGGGGGGDDDDMRVPENSKSVFFSGWMSKLGAKTQRRGSLGFSDSHSGTPPSRLDDDSNSGYMEDKLKSGTMSAISTKKSGISRKRNDSNSDLQGMTPGDDGDLYFLRNKFRRDDSDNNLQDAAQSSIHVTTDGMLKLDIAKPAEPHRETPMPGANLPTLREDKVLSLETETRYAHEENGLRETTTARPFAGIAEKSKKPEDSEGSIFLIDLEEMEDSGTGRTILKPQSKKFSASSILQSKFAQNWFFKNNEDDADTDCLVTEEEEESRKTSRSSIDSRDSEKSILTKIKTLVEKTPTKHREMNLLQPQGT